MQKLNNVYLNGVLISQARDRGVVGVYDSHKTDQIWSMGEAYKNAADGSNFGNLYGLAYKHTNNKTGGTMAGSHQAVWVENGNPKAAMGGDGLWGLAVFDGNGSNRQRVYSPNNRNITDAVNNPSSTVYGSARSVKSAYDKAVQALSKANSKWSYVMASTSVFGATKLSSAINSTSEALAATPKAVKMAYDLAASKITKAQGDGWWLGKTAKAVDSDKVDGLHGSQLLRSDADDEMTGRLSIKKQHNYPLKLGSVGDLGKIGIEFAGQGTAGTQKGYFWSSHKDGDSSGGNYSYHFESTENKTNVILHGAGNYMVNGHQVWHAGNDGSGSGLDADKVDGLQGSQLIRSDADDVVTGNTQWASGHAPYLKDNANGGRIPAPAGAYLYNGASSATGAIKIKLPTITKGQSDMLSFEVSIFDYAANESVKLLIAGYQYSSKDWTNQTVITLTNSAGKDYRVRFGNDGTSHCLWIGETNSTWNHLQIGVFNVLVGYSADATKYASGWTVSIVTKYDTVQDTVSASLPAAQTATKLQSARTIALAGDATGSTTFDGSGNKTITVTVKDDSHNHVIGNVDGLQAALDGKLAKGAKAADSAKLNGKVPSTAPSGNTIAQRDGAGDLSARLVRTTYANQTSAPSSSAAIVFRNNNSNDNFLRAMTKTAMKAWLTLTKSDVGLSSVVNAPQTSAVNDASTTKYATAKGVKTAYDKAVSAYNLANGKMTQATGDGRYLGKTAKAADANKLDGKDSTAFVQTSGNQTVAGKKTFNDEIGLTSKAGIKFDAATESINFVFH